MAKAINKLYDDELIAAGLPSLSSFMSNAIYYKDDINKHLNDVLEMARRLQKDDAKRGREWAVMITDLQKVIAWQVTYLAKYSHIEAQS